MEITLLLRGLAIGLAIAAPVGPIGILCIRQSLTFGWMRGFVAGLGAATADATYGFVAGFGLTFITSFLVAQQFWLRLVGGIFLCYLGIKTFTSIPVENAVSATSNTTSTLHSLNPLKKRYSLASLFIAVFNWIKHTIVGAHGCAPLQMSRTQSKIAIKESWGDLIRVYTSTFALTLTNPATILSFAAIFSGLGLASIERSYFSALLLVVGVFLGSALWWLLLSSGVILVRTKLNAIAFKWVNRLSGILITAFGIFSLLKSKL